eukprot:370201-Amphidinium_carterae.2
MAKGFADPSLCTRVLYGVAGAACAVSATSNELNSGKDNLRIVKFRSCFGSSCWRWAPSAAC